MVLIVAAQLLQPLPYVPVPSVSAVLAVAVGIAGTVVELAVVPATVVLDTVDIAAVELVAVAGTAVELVEIGTTAVPSSVRHSYRQ